MSRILIVPGFNGSDVGHWQHHWLQDDPNAALVEQESWGHPVLWHWLHKLEADLIANPHAVLVGHSLGAVLIAHLAGRAAAAHVDGALLVAPSDLEAAQRRHPGRIDFGLMPRRPLPFPSIVVASRDDPYMTWNQSREYAGIWGSGMVDLGNAGHINIASGYGRWEEAYPIAHSLSRNSATLRTLAAAQRGVSVTKGDLRAAS
jgi:uncharacterized protein